MLGLLAKNIEAQEVTCPCTMPAANRQVLCVHPSAMVKPRQNYKTVYRESHLRYTNPPPHFIRGPDRRWELHTESLECRLGTGSQGVGCRFQQRAVSTVPGTPWPLSTEIANRLLY